MILFFLIAGVAASIMAVLVVLDNETPVSTAITVRTFTYLAASCFILATAIHITETLS